MPVGTKGDNFDRLHVPPWSEEMRQSGAHHRAGARTDARRGAASTWTIRASSSPRRRACTRRSKRTIQHFKIRHGGHQGARRASATLVHRGRQRRELGFTSVSDGSGTPYRVRIRPPCFASVAGLGQLINGLMIPDVVPTFGSLNMIGGEQRPRAATGASPPNPGLTAKSSPCRQSRSTDARSPSSSGRHHHQAPRKRAGIEHLPTTAGTRVIGRGSTAACALVEVPSHRRVGPPGDDARHPALGRPEGRTTSRRQRRKLSALPACASRACYRGWRWRFPRVEPPRRRGARSAVQEPTAPEPPRSTA